MSRLYVDNKNTNGNIRTMGEANGKPTSPTKSYFEKVAKLVPSEIIAGFLAMCGFVPNIGDDSINSRTVYLIIFGFCLILTPVYLNFFAEKDKPKRIHLIISSLAFVVWAYVTTGSELFPDFYNAAIASIILVAFSLVSALIPLNK